MIINIDSTAGQIGPFWWINQERHIFHDREVPGLCGFSFAGEEDPDEEPEEQGDEWLSWSRDYDR